MGAPVPKCPGDIASPIVHKGIDTHAQPAHIAILARCTARRGGRAVQAVGCRQRCLPITSRAGRNGVLAKRPHMIRYR
jgi:hypothetical protein